jgi:glycosyltransferase involved in cell wall biosynthesis
LRQEAIVHSGDDVSVVICAYTEKRWDDTLAAVGSVGCQTLAPREVVVVVDHNRPLYERLRAALPNVAVVENREAPGLSGARNTGISMSGGEVVAFLDDDAIAAPDWLKFLMDPYSKPEVMGVGGLVHPLWAAERRPTWFPEEFDWVVGCSYRGLPLTPSPVRNLLGGNASFRREVFTVAGAFRSGIGRSAASRPYGCEETELCIRLAQARPGSVLVSDHRAVVWHRVPADRTRFRYFRSRCYAEGLSKALVAGTVGTADGLASERTYVTRTLPAGVLRGLSDALHGRPTGLARSAAIAAGLAFTVSGYGVGAARQRLASLSASSDRMRQGHSRSRRSRRGP